MLYAAAGARRGAVALGFRMAAQATEDDGQDQQQGE
jgi:hypothetical protein